MEVFQNQERKFSLLQNCYCLQNYRCSKVIDKCWHLAINIADLKQYDVQVYDKMMN
jgi:hypothetical protein